LSILSSWRIYPHLQNTGGFFVAVLERSPSVAIPIPGKQPPKRSASEAQGTPDREGEFHLSPPERVAKRPRLNHPEEDITVDTEMTDAEIIENDAHEEPPKTAVEEKQSKGWIYKEDPYTYVDPTHPNVQRCL
jgi:multisite-specific tRNA:(cytosine-C5)-methyltransferase